MGDDVTDLAHVATFQPRVTTSSPIDGRIVQNTAVCTPIFRQKCPPNVGFMTTPSLTAPMTSPKGRWNATTSRAGVRQRHKRHYVDEGVERDVSHLPRR